MIVKDQSSLCFSCHEQNLGENAANIKSTHVPFQEGECTKCHSPHKAKLDKLVLAGYPDLCLSCHKALKAKMYKEEECAKAKKREEAGMEVGPLDVECDGVTMYVHAPSDLRDCKICHRPHFSPETGLIKRPVQELCGECHDFNKPSFKKGHLNIDPQVMDCRKCHDPHTSDDPMFFKEVIHPLFKARSCGDCHLVEQ